MRISGVTNNECQTVVKTVTISKTSEVETTWNIGRETMLGITGSITAKIPLIGSGGIELSGEKTLQFSRGTTVVEALSHSVSVELTVPPNHYCRVRMEGRKIKADIPYTARLSRTYRNWRDPVDIHLWNSTMESRSEKSVLWWTAVNQWLTPSLAPERLMENTPKDIFAATSDVFDIKRKLCVTIKIMPCTCCAVNEKHLLCRMVSKRKYV
ncbi:Natterin-4, partial [Larimichthys crocea]